MPEDEQGVPTVTRHQIWRAARILWLVICVQVSTGCKTVRSMPPLASPGSVTVLVASSHDSWDLQGVHVFILSKGGRILAEATTDEFGAARLREPRADEEPAFLLAEHPSFFLGGTRWTAGYREFYIELAIGKVP